MALLPEDINIGAEVDVIFEDYPTNTYYVDPLTHQIQRFTDGLEAMTQAVEIILYVERYKFQIYTPNFGVEFEGLIGEPYGFVMSEIKRRIQDAFFPDTRIIEARDFVFNPQPENGDLIVEFVVVTVFGNFPYQTSISM